MKQLFLSAAILSAFLLASNTAAAQIANPGFETWTNNQPDGWATFGALLNDVQRSTTAHSGSAALRANVVMFNNVATGSLVQGGTGSQGFPVSARIGSIEGFYQFNSVAKDQFYVAVLLFGGASGTSELVGGGDFTTADGTGATWAKFTVPIQYISATMPQTITISMVVDSAPDSSDPHIGSYYIVDDIAYGAVTAVNEPETSLPHVFSLSQNFPNPFNPSTTIRYNVPKESDVTLSVYNTLGEEVKTLVTDVKQAGAYEAVWNGDDKNGARVGSGLYFYRMHAGTFTDVKRMMLVK